MYVASPYFVFTEAMMSHLIYAGTILQYVGGDLFWRPRPRPAREVWHRCMKLLLIVYYSTNMIPSSLCRLRYWNQLVGFVRKYRYCN